MTVLKYPVPDEEEEDLAEEIVSFRLKSSSAVDENGDEEDDEEELLLPSIRLLGLELVRGSRGGRLCIYRKRIRGKDIGGHVKGEQSIQGGDAYAAAVSSSWLIPEESMEEDGIQEEW